MTKRVGIREAKAKLSHFVALARSGTDVVITDRGRPMVRLVAVPRTAPKRTVEEALAELVDQGLIEPGATGFVGPLPKPVRLRRKVDVVALVREQRR